MVKAKYFTHRYCITHEVLTAAVNKISSASNFTIAVSLVIISSGKFIQLEELP
jgi:hypothetical protein